MVTTGVSARDLTGVAVESIELVHVSIPVRRPFVWGPGWHITDAEYVIVRVRADDGSIGLGEAAPSINSLGDSPQSVLDVVEQHLAPLVVGKPLFGLGDLRTAFADVSRNYAAKAAVEFAVVDAMAHATGLPLWRFLGGVRSEVPLVWMTGAGSPATIVEELHEAAGRGFEWFKLKVAADVAEAVAIVRAAREAFPEAHLYVDPNQQLGNGLFAFVDACRELNLAFLEEPVRWRNSPRRAALLGHTGLPTLADESAETVERACAEIEVGPSDMVSIKPPRLGVANTRLLGDLCRQHHKQAWIGSHAETDLGALACAHLAGGFEAFDAPSELAFYQTLTGSLLRESIDGGGASIMLTEKPGLGVELDEEAVEHWAVERRICGRPGGANHV